MSGDLAYEDLQFKDRNIYSVLDASDAKQPKSRWDAHAPKGGKQENSNTNLQKLRADICAINGGSCSYCPQNWMYHSGHCYYFSTDLMNWTQSKADCAVKESKLAIIKSQEEETFAEVTGPGLTWIGLSKNTDGLWIWEDGTTLEKGQDFWRREEPNNQGGNENCGELLTAIYGNESQWNDGDCANQNRRICERPAAVFTP
ncbi:hepatic lectin-like isoform X2 [Ambystoma mexicanum]|uniref:hepatic lectin-like isoform X2 n=1 Tax=Ambystoma mexicanum TaxID=8296 RepID=UPI0037E9970E